MEVIFLNGRVFFINTKREKSIILLNSVFSI